MYYEYYYYIQEISEGISLVELEFEYRCLVFDFKYDLPVIKHSELKITLGICRAYLF